MKLTTKRFALLVFAFSFILPVFVGDDIIGLGAFWLASPLFGLMKVGTWNIAWLANLLIISLLLDKDNKRFTLSLVAVLLALSVIIDSSIQITGPLYDSKSHILSIGYYFWLLSFVILFSEKWVALMDRKAAGRKFA